VKILELLQQKKKSSFPLLKSLVSKNIRPFLLKITSFWVTEHLIKVLTPQILYSASKPKPSIAPYKFLASINLKKVWPKPQILTPLAPVVLGSMFKVLLLDKYCTEILLKIGPVIDT
jgi:hypothetical protein